MVNCCRVAKDDRVMVVAAAWESGGDCIEEHFLIKSTVLALLEVFYGFFNRFGSDWDVGATSSLHGSFGSLLCNLLLDLFRLTVEYRVVDVLKL